MSVVKYYSRSMADRSGAQIHDILFAKAYCIKHNYKYIGCKLINHIDATRSLLSYLNIDNPFESEYSQDAEKLSHDLYRKGDSDVFDTDTRNQIISNFNYNYNTDFVITLHLRRGDVDPVKYPDRYLDNNYYKNILNKVLVQLKQLKHWDTNNIVINVCSESRSFEPLDEFEEIYSDYNIKLHLDTSLESVFHDMIHADVLILSKSSFSFVPAFYNKRCVIYHPFWHKKLHDWLDSTDVKFDINLRESIKAFNGYWSFKYKQI